MSSTKTCEKCGEEKHVSAFPRIRSLQRTRCTYENTKSVCRSCKKKSGQERFEELNSLPPNPIHSMDSWGNLPAAEDKGVDAAKIFNHKKNWH